MRASRIVSGLLAIIFISMSAGGAVICTPSTVGSQPPLAADDIVYVATAGTGVPVAVLSNDVVSTTGSLAIINVSTPAHGTTTKNADNTITYTPTTLDPDTFTYTIVDTTLTDSPTSQATVQVVPRSGFQIDVECHGGECLFDAVPASLAGIRSFTWSFGDGTPEWTGWTRAFHAFSQEGSYTVRARADYYSGQSDLGTIVVSIVLQRSLIWTLTVNGLSARIDVDYDSLLGFPGGATAAQVKVSFGDNRDDCLYLCGVWAPISVWPYPQPISDAYYRTGTYPVRVTVTDSTNTTHHFAKYATVVNNPPVPDFTFVRDGAATFSYTFDPRTSHDEFDIDSDPPFAPSPYEWDFGDGMSAVEPRATPVTHVFPGPGQYTVGLRLTDAGGEVGFATRTVEVQNAPPVPHISVNCRVLDCTFGSDGTRDDGNDVRTFQWELGDGTTAAGPTVTKQFAAAGCYIVRLTATDGANAQGSVTQTVPVGPPVFATAGGAVVDAHVQSYTFGSEPSTSTGNLNGILEPGEAAVVEPQWQAAPSSQPVSVFASGLTSTDWVYASPLFHDFAGSYDLTTGTSDCWSSGRCYVVKLQTNTSGRGTNAHNDITFTETYNNGQPTPGSPILIHVGASFTDVPVGHWAYPYIESVLHAGIAGATNGLSFSPHAAVTRGQIAQWLVLAKHGAAFQPPECVTPPFNDVPCTHPYANWIAQIKVDGITTAGGNYLPDANVTRAELSVLVLRAKEGPAYTPPACQWDFGDAPCPQYWAAAWISEVKRRDISTGCALNEFCPDDGVDRAQAASFVARAFGLNLATKACATSQQDVVPGHVPRPPIVSLTFNPSPVFVGDTSTGTLTLGLATQNGVTVPLTIDNPSAATIPASVFVPPGLFSATFTVTPANVLVRTPTNISATYLGQTKTTRLDVCTPAPSITAQPASHIIYNGQSTTLSVTASGGGALDHQWYEGIAPSTVKPIGTNSPSINIAPRVTTNYWVKVSNACASTNSNTATVTVCDYPVITQPPLDDIVVTGSTTTLGVTVTGSGPIGYQWYEGTSGTTTTPVGSNSPTFTTPAITTARSYWVRVTSTCNGLAVVDSATATITPITQVTRRQIAGSTVNSLPSITANWSRPTQQGSLLVAVMTSSHVAAVGAFTPPAGWLQAVEYGWSNLKTTIYYYPNNPGGRTSETIITASFRDSVLQLIEYAGATASPLDVNAFDGDNQPRSGAVSTGTTQWMTQPKAVIVSALSTNTLADFTNPSNSFVQIDERSVFQSLTAAVHERMVSAVGNYGHTASVDTTAQWLGMIAIFKSIDACTAAPAITAQPASTTVAAATSATLSVTATGGSLGYQWYQGTTPSTTAPVPGGNGPTLTVTPAATTSYWVRVFNACGSVNSNTATVNVCAPLGIAAHPLSQSVTSGFSATLSVTPSGSGPFSYQWYEGASGVTTTPVGTNSATFTTPGLTATKSYWVRVTSTCLGTTTVNSNAAVLTVASANQIARRQLAASWENSQTSITTNWTQPTQAGSLLVAVLSAQHGATVGPFTPPAGWQLATSYEMANIKSAIYYYPSHPGGRTSETFGVAGFRELVLQLIEYTGATATPLDKVALNGEMLVNGGLVSTGTTAATSQAKEAVVTALAIMAPATFTNPTNGFVKLDQRSVEYIPLTAAVHEQIVMAAGAYGHEANVDANTQWVGLVATFKSLDLCSAPPAIATQPASKSISPGQTATLTVTATTNGGTLGYQWYEGASGTTTTPVGTNSPTFTTPALTVTKSYWVRVSNACGNAASTAATVTVCVPPGIGTQPAPKTINSGQTATLSVTANGSGPFSYQWYEGTSGTTTTPVGTNSSSFTTPALATTKSYWVRVSSTCNGTASVDSNSATVTVCTPPGIATQPQPKTINSGTTATLSVVASGSGPFNYQWYEGASGTTTTPVGTNSASFTTPALTATKSYWVRVTSTCNGTASVDSSAATVTVCNATGITMHPAPQTINSGGTATLSVTASGSPPFSYQWYEGPSGTTTTPVGTNSATFTTPVLNATKSYWVRVTGGCGTASSNAAVITVCTLPGIGAHPASQTIGSGATATLSVTPSGSGPFSYQWYEGASGTTTTPVGTNSATFTTPALTATKSYWVRLTSTCNGTATVNSNTATVTVNAPVLARRQFAASTANSQLTITTNWIQPTQAGNLLVAIVSAERSWYPIANWQPPAGWQLAVSYEMTNVKTSIYYYPNNPGGRTAEAFGNGGFYDDMILQLAEYTGVATVSPLDKTAFNGNASNDGYVETGYTQQTSQAKELVITALTSYSMTNFHGPSQGFIEIDDRHQGWGNLTTAVHEKIVTTAGSWGHYTQVDDPAQWVGVVATFKGQ